MNRDTGAASDGELREVGGPALAELEDLERSCFAEPWTAPELALYLGSGAIRAFVWSAPGSSPAAYAVFQLLPGECELLRLGVRPEERRRGTAARMLGDALAELAGRGHADCHLEVRADNVAARRLYAGLGFRLVGRRRGYYADGEDALRYRRAAAPAGG